MSTNVLTLDALRLAYGDLTVTEGINLKVDAGEWVSILGASGCGKSSILRAIAGFMTPTNGSIELFGVPASAAPEHRGVGMVFQDFALFNHLSVRANIAFGLNGSSKVDERVDELLERCELTELADRLPDQLSGGQQQRVGLARALAPRPKLLLLDEPFANLDADLRNDLGAWCAEQIRLEGAAALLVTHDRREAMALSHRIAVLDGTPATIRQCDTVQNLYEKPLHPSVARQLGEVLMVPARAAGMLARSNLGEHQLLGEHQGSVQLVLRPDDLDIRSDEQGQAKVETRYFAEGSWHHAISYNGQRLIISQPEPMTGERCQIASRRPVWALPTSS